MHTSCNNANPSSIDRWAGKTNLGWMDRHATIPQTESPENTIDTSTGKTSLQARRSYRQDVSTGKTSADAQITMDSQRHPHKQDVPTGRTSPGAQNTIDTFTNKTSPQTRRPQTKRPRKQIRVGEMNTGRTKHHEHKTSPQAKRWMSIDPIINPPTILPWQCNSPQIMGRLGNLTKNFGDSAFHRKSIFPIVPRIQNHSKSTH